MLELNGELLKPLDEPRRIPQANLLPGCTAVDDVRRRIELGSLKFDADVSAICFWRSTIFLAYRRTKYCRRWTPPAIFCLSHARCS